MGTQEEGTSSFFPSVYLTGVTVILTMGIEVVGLNRLKHLLSPCPVSAWVCSAELPTYPEYLEPYTESWLSHCFLFLWSSVLSEILYYSDPRLPQPVDSKEMMQHLQSEAGLTSQIVSFPSSVKAYRGVIVLDWAPAVNPKRIDWNGGTGDGSTGKSTFYQAWQPVQTLEHNTVKRAACCPLDV